MVKLGIEPQVDISKVVLTHRHGNGPQGAINIVVDIQAIEVQIVGP
jgi:hypothetical protein